MKLKRDLFFKLYKVMNEIDSKQYNKYFLKSISFNKKQLKEMIEDINLKSSVIYTEKYFNLKRDFEQVTSEEQAKYLSESNKEYIEEIGKKEKEFVDYVSEEIEIELETIKFEHVPEMIHSDVYNTLEILFEKK